MVEYRPVSSDEADRYERIRQYAFHPEDGPEVADSDIDHSSPGERYGLFEDGELRSICRLYTFDARLRGEWIDLGGLGTVATPPEHRRNGYARRLLENSVETYAAESVPLVTLWPFDVAFYRQFGWETANKLTSYECPPETLIGVGDGEGTFRPVEPEDWQSLRDAHLLAGEDETLSLRRSQTWWRRRIFSKWGETRRHVYRYDRDGTPAGYVAHSIEDGHLEVASLAAIDHDAYRAVLEFLGTHGSQIERISLERAAESELFDLVGKPDALECRVDPGAMVRVTDVTTALEAVPYPEDVTETVTFAVRDGLVARNDGTVRLRVTDGTGDVTAHPEADPDATLDVGALSRLVVGGNDAATAIRHGQVSLESPDVGRQLDRLFPSERVFLREFF